MQADRAQFLVPPPPYEEFAPSRPPPTTNESAPPYQTYATRPTTAHGASDSVQTPDDPFACSPASPGGVRLMSLPDAPDAATTARLPAYRRIGYGRYRTHPYRRPLEWARDEDEDADMICELENITISDVISTPEYIDAASHPDAASNLSAAASSSSPNHLHPVLTTNPIDWDTLTSSQRAARLSQRIADIDYALSGLDVAMLNDLERTIIDFALFVRQNLAQRRAVELFPGNNLF
ncbi:uncharacterized protein SCHCODRAFT_02607585 [Schizophyllum commune H4-8]|nr:uncharacterized protein SCHCODRAFT_02607585 [Schizophyllum commune H4-8]KAI5900304.1 hypothetical protein SCHCODRAFT_02607585 [Schizophyllum commune H4-8]